MPNTNVITEVTTEAVEVCPNCEAENVFPNWDTEKQGYIAICHECGEAIFLCDECLHAQDNPGGKCDWHEAEDGEYREGWCFRGTTRNKINIED